MLNLVVGDPHAVPEELEDCRALWDLVVRTVAESNLADRIDVVTVLGDLYHSHDAVSVRVQDFWRRALAAPELEGTPVVLLRGNHDQAYPDRPAPHALAIHAREGAFQDGIAPRLVVDGPTELETDWRDWRGDLAFQLPGVVALPYYRDGAEFLVAAAGVGFAHPGAHTLICHQTFLGGVYENGTPARDDAVDPAPVVARFPHVISGHLHRPQHLQLPAGWVDYPGAPRWRTRWDANCDRHLTVWEHTRKGTRLAGLVPTGDACRRIWVYDDRPGEPAPVSAGRHPADDLRIDVYGPSVAYCRDRAANLREVYGIEPRQFPDRVARLAVDATPGAPALGGFLDTFDPPNGTPKDVLRKEVEARLA